MVFPSDVDVVAVLLPEGRELVAEGELGAVGGGAGAVAAAAGTDLVEVISAAEKRGNRGARASLWDARAPGRD